MTSKHEIKILNKALENKDFNRFTSLLSHRQEKDHQALGELMLCDDKFKQLISFHQNELLAFIRTKWNNSSHDFNFLVQNPFFQELYRSEQFLFFYHGLNQFKEEFIWSGAYAEPEEELEFQLANNTLQILENKKSFIDEKYYNWFSKQFLKHFNDEDQEKSWIGLYSIAIHNLMIFEDKTTISHYTQHDISEQKPKEKQAHLECLDKIKNYLALDHWSKPLRKGFYHHFFSDHQNNTSLKIKIQNFYHVYGQELHQTIETVRMKNNLDQNLESKEKTKNSLKI